jgi:hypothetical protein
VRGPTSKIVAPPTSPSPRYATGPSLSPLRAERGSLIPYPFWKWPAAQAAVLMRNKHREIATFVCYVRSMKETIGSVQHEGRTLY